MINESILETRRSVYTHNRNVMNDQRVHTGTRRSIYTHTRNVMNDQRVHTGNTSFNIHTQS